MNKKVREYYMCLLGMFGEIVSLHASEHAPAAKTTAGDELRLMMKDKLIRYHKHSDRKRTFRISDPAGFEYIKNIDTRLHEHAEMIVGTDVRYTGSRDYRLKKRKESVLMFNLLSAGLAVDGARLNGEKELIFESPSLISAAEIIKAAPSGKAFFLSGPLLKRDKSTTHQRREMSISTGTLFSRGGIYTTYSITTSRFRWYQEAERISAESVARLYEDSLDLERRSDGRNRAIFFTEDKEIAGEMIEQSGYAGRKMDPLGIFRLTYLVPLEDKDFAMDVAKMLTIPDWRVKTDKILGLAPSGKHDGIAEDGKKIYNLLCCNLAKLHEVEGEIKRGVCRVVIHDWQKEVFDKLYATEIDAIVLEPKHFKGLLLSISE